MAINVKAPVTGCLSLVASMQYWSLGERDAHWRAVWHFDKYEEWATSKDRLCEWQLFVLYEIGILASRIAHRRPAA